ncbi:hypothetical protein L249_2059 [Ophiocordyceps polyrhachis-furcata BCC 54312]|uniref:Translation initiation factor eIF2B subunit delta n=1 Tax=Ophiocordyceps polyrhachis-furcata BCC 54312 TaxID=1330021 RepID=A0A367LTK8_9HYPO|nr:hypothetical protein L249_2059 [Ophiocordyceps polyrhachis-furcata BCC 54312]
MASESSAADTKKKRTTNEAPGTNEQLLSNAERKKKAKEEKAARRAAAKSAPPQQAQQQQTTTTTTANEQPRSAVGSTTRTRVRLDGASTPRPQVPECFSHLSMARRLAITQADKDVHPTVLALGQYMGCFAVGDSITRLEATLLAFKKVIDSYTTPHGATFSRHFTSHVLNPQIDYLAACRPMCFSMGNAIRWLKLQISKLDIDLPDSEAKKHLRDLIDSFISERITLADFVIVKTAAEMVSEGDVVVVYGRHHLVERALLKARSQGRRFKVVVVDDAFERVGIDLAKVLAKADVAVTYMSDLGALRTTLSRATLVMAAAEAMFSNGAMYARAGTCDVATVAADLGLRVVALCESINFTERVAIDSLTYNEIDPESCHAEGFRLLFDTTMHRYISVVVTELGTTSAKSVPAILRKVEEL